MNFDSTGGGDGERGGCMVNLLVYKASLVKFEVRLTTALQLPFINTMLHLTLTVTNSVQLA